MLDDIAGAGRSVLIRLVPVVALTVAATGCTAETATTGPAEPTSAPDPAAVARPAPTATSRTTEVPQVVEGDGFTITFPSPVSSQTVEVPLDQGGTTQATIYEAQLGEAFLGFSHADTPDAGQELDFDAEQALLDSARGAAETTGGEVARADIVTFRDRPAVDYVIAAPGGVLRGFAFFDGPRLYTGQLVAPGEAVDRAPLDKLLASLRLT